MSEWAFRSLNKSSPHSLVKSCSFFFFKFPGKNWAKHFHGASGFETNKDKNCHISLVSCLSRALNSFLYSFSSKEIILQTFFLLGMPSRISKPGAQQQMGIEGSYLPNGKLKCFLKIQNNRDSASRPITKIDWRLVRCEPSSPSTQGSFRPA